MVVKLDNAEKLERRVDISAELSDYVYTYEQNYTKFLKREESKNIEVNVTNINKKAINTIENRMPSDTTITDAMYDEETGVAALAVEDSQT
ncbi:hypothetical protein DDV23_06940, partial [Streptococcus chenjunshii]